MGLRASGEGFRASWEGLRTSWEGLGFSWVSLGAGRASELAWRASEPAGRALDPVRKASEQVRIASEEAAARPKVAIRLKNHLNTLPRISKLRCRQLFLHLSGAWWCKCKDARYTTYLHKFRLYDYVQNRFPNQLLYSSCPYLLSFNEDGVVFFTAICEWSCN